MNLRSFLPSLLREAELRNYSKRRGRGEGLAVLISQSGASLREWWLRGQNIHKPAGNSEHIRACWSCTSAPQPIWRQKQQMHSVFTEPGSEKPHKLLLHSSAEDECKHWKDILHSKSLVGQGTKCEAPLKTKDRKRNCTKMCRAPLYILRRHLISKQKYMTQQLRYLK